MNRRILFVCLGNICRSPAAEGVFKHLLELKGLSAHYYIDSAGTGPWHVGKKADARMREAAEKRGVKITSIARQFQIKDLDEFDLILTMDNDNLSSLQDIARENCPDKISKIKPILSYAKSSSVEEVPDPYYGSQDGFEIVLDLLELCCEGLIDQTS